MCMESESWSDIQKDAEQVTPPPVQFIDILDRYSVLQDLEVVIQLGEKFVASVDDWVGLFPLEWRTLKQYVAYQWIGHQDRRQTITITKSKLPNDFKQYYQLMYINGNTTVVGLSTPFFFTDEEVFIDAKGEGELEKELLRREIIEREKMSKTTSQTRLSESTITLGAESKLTIDMIPEESLTSIIADTSALFEEDITSICQAILPDTELDPRQFKHSSGDNPEFALYLNTDSMALVPWNQQEFVWKDGNMTNEMTPDNLTVKLEDKKRNIQINPDVVKKSTHKKVKRKDPMVAIIPLDENGRAHISRVTLPQVIQPPSPPKSTNVDTSSPKSTSSKHSLPSSGTSSESLDPGSSAKSCRKDANLDQVVSRFFNFLGSVIARSESEKSLASEKSTRCARCSQLEIDLESTKSRAFHAEYKEQALVREVVNLKKQIKQQELRTAELLDHLQQQCDDNGNVEILKGQLTQVLDELQQAAHTIHRLNQEKTTLETKVGNLVWEKAALCAKLQVIQQAEAKNSRKTSELSTALVEAQEEVHHLSRRHSENQQFIDALLATLATLGYTAIRDTAGSCINLENLAGPGLPLEPLVTDDSEASKWSRKSKVQQHQVVMKDISNWRTKDLKYLVEQEQENKWYNAITASQDVIQQLQKKIHDLEEFCKRQEATSNHVTELQKCLTDERQKSKLLENQMNQMMLSFNVSPSIEAQDSASPSFETQNYNDRLTTQSTDLSQSTLGYEHQGARPKFMNRQQLCEPVDELENQESQNRRSRFRSPCTYSPSVSVIDNYPPNCPYCGESFPAYLLPNDKQEHIRMHMYSELERSVTKC